MKDLASLFKPVLSVKDLANTNEHLRSLTDNEIKYQLPKLYPGIEFFGPIGADHNGNLHSWHIKVPAGHINSNKKWESFVNALDSMMWYITINYKSNDIREVGGRKCWYMDIEPVQADDVTKMVHKVGHLFHITDGSRLRNEYTDDTITNIGLRAKGWAKTKYRYFPNRIHFICPADGKDFKECLYQIINDLGLNLDELRIFSVDVSKLNKNIRFYHDPVYPDKRYVYSFINMPWSIMSEIKI